MPRAARTKQPDAGAIYVCWQSGSAEVDGQTFSFNRGQRLRGDNPIVQNCGQFFVADGTPGDQMPSHWDQVVERNEVEQPAPEFEISLTGPVPQALEPERTITLTRDVTVRAGLVADREVVTFDKGSVFSATSELAERLTDDAFEPSSVQFTRPNGRRR